MRWQRGALLTCFPLFAARAQSPVRAGHIITPDTVTLGQPFRLEIRVQAPVGATIEFPEVPDSTGTVQALDPRIIRNGPVRDGEEQTAVYRMAAWDLGVQPITLPDVIVHWQGGEEHISLTMLRVVVQSVLPSDTALRIPKPARDLFVQPRFPWWLPVVLVAIAVMLVWWYWRRRRDPELVAVVDPFTRAEREFARIVAMGLVEAGERGQFVTLVVEVVRDYLAARYPQAALSLTTEELLGALFSEHAVPNGRLAQLLHDVDLVKFARRTVSLDRALEVLSEAIAIVAHDHVASTPLPEAEAA